jgi:hypothetical protein
MTPREYSEIILIHERRTANQQALEEIEMRLENMRRGMVQDTQRLDVICAAIRERGDLPA